MFAWLCLRMRYPQNSNGSYMIIYDVPYDNDYLMGYLVYPIFRHTHIYQDMILHKTSVGCALYTSLFQIMVFGCERKVDEGGNRVKWRASNGPQALRSYPWPVGFAQTASQKVDEHASFLRSSAKWFGQGYLGPTANLGQNHDLHPGFLVTQTGCYINQILAFPLHSCLNFSFEPYPTQHHIWFS